MFKRLSNALQYASSDKRYLAISVLLFVTLMSSYFINHPVVWVLCIIEIIIMFGLIVLFYIRNEGSNE